MPAPLSIFALGSTAAFGAQVAAHLGTELARVEERSFEDGEHKVRPLDSVRNRDVFVIDSLYGGDAQSVNDRFVKVLFFVGALRDAAAASVTAVLPYLCYSRKDRRTKRRDPVSTRYVAQLLEAMGTDRVVTLDVHNLAAFQNAFRCRTEHLEASGLFARYLEAHLDATPLAVVSPDIGGVKRARDLQQRLQQVLDRDIEFACVEKYRSEGVVSGERLLGPVANRRVVLVDDLISAGTTLARAARLCRDHGAISVWAVATHGLFTSAGEDLGDAVLDRVIVTDSIATNRLPHEGLAGKLSVVACSGLLAEAITRIHGGGSVVALLEEGWRHVS